MVSPPLKLFVEGGGNHNDALKTECRRAFTALLEKAGFTGRLPRVVACGGRRNAYEQFCTAIDGGEGLAILLVDSEAPVATEDPWLHVAQRAGDGWNRPAGATAEHLHLMVQCMEAWFLADRRALREYFGQGLQENALPAEALGPEDVRKPDLYSKLSRRPGGPRQRAPMTREGTPSSCSRGSIRAWSARVARGPNGSLRPWPDGQSDPA